MAVNRRSASRLPPVGHPPQGSASQERGAAPPEAARRRRHPSTWKSLADVPHDTGDHEGKGIVRSEAFKEPINLGTLRMPPQAPPTRLMGHDILATGPIKRPPCRHRWPHILPRSGGFRGQRGDGAWLAPRRLRSTVAPGDPLGLVPAQVYRRLPATRAVRREFARGCQ